jgi:hypothetical protein
MASSRIRNSLTPPRPGDQPTYRTIQFPLKQIVVVALLGGLGFASWSLRSRDETGAEANRAAGDILDQVQSGAVPKKVFGGGREIKLWTTLSDKGSVRVIFEPTEDAPAKYKRIDKTETLRSGEHVFLIDVAEGTSGSVLACMDHPTVPASVEVMLEGVDDHTTSNEQKRTEPSKNPLCAELQLNDWANAGK